MSTKLLLASLLATACSAAYADRPTPPTPPGPPSAPVPTATCNPVGPILFEARTVSRDVAETRSAVLPVVKLYETGAWEYDELAGGKLTIQSSGCLARDKMQAIREDLAGSKWIVTHHQLHCEAYALSYTEYSVRGKHVWTAIVCGDDSLDEASQKHLAEIDAILADARKPVTPPCCKK